MKNYKIFIQGFAAITMMMSCKQSHDRVNTFTEADNPVAMTEVEKAEWTALQPGLKASWTDPGLHHPISAVPAQDGSDTCRLVGWRGERVGSEILLWAPDSVSGVRGTVSDFRRVADPAGHRENNAGLQSAIAELRFVRYTL